MLIEFSVENYKSIAERQTLSLVAGTRSKKSRSTSFETGNSLAPYLLNLASIFGANGAGKSNIVLGLEFIQDMVTYYPNRLSALDKIPTVPYKLDSCFIHEPSEFEIIFIHNEILYQFGFAVNRDRVISEWLFEKPNKKGSTLKELYRREFDETENKYLYEYPSPRLTGHKKVWEESTGKNTLFLATAVKMNSEVLQNAYEWFYTQLRPLSSKFGFNDEFTSKQVIEKKNKGKILDFLAAADTNIHDLEIEEVEVEYDDRLQEMFSREIIEKFKEQTLTSFNVQTVHKMRDNNLCKLELSEESEGSQKIYSYSGLWLDVLENGKVLIIDELHRSLHPNALRFLISMFMDPQINKKNAQLVFTTHDTSILISHLLNNDQIWFVEKGKNLASELFNASDFNSREFSTMQKAYLDGRFGAVPKIGAVSYD